MGLIIPFPIRRAESGDLSIDLPFLSGDLLGVHLTEWDEIAVFVEHEGDAVGGLLTIPQAIELRTALGAMLDRSFARSPSNGGA